MNENGLIIVRNRRSTSCIFYDLPTQPSAAHDSSFVSYRHVVGYRRSPGDSGFPVTRLIGWSRMSLWSAMVVSIQAHGSGGRWPLGRLAAPTARQYGAWSMSGPWPPRRTPASRQCPQT